MAAGVETVDKDLSGRLEDDAFATLVEVTATPYSVCSQDADVVGIVAGVHHPDVSVVVEGRAVHARIVIR